MCSYWSYRLKKVRINAGFFSFGRRLHTGMGMLRDCGPMLERDEDGDGSLALVMLAVFVYEVCDQNGEPKLITVKMSAVECSNRWNRTYFFLNSPGLSAASLTNGKSIDFIYHAVIIVSALLRANFTSYMTVLHM